jgi:hypothetical protein
MKSFAKCMIASAVIALPIQAIAATAPAKCITHDEFRAVAATLLPSVIGAAMNKCGETLDKSDYLVAKGPDLLARYQSFAKGKEGALVTVMDRLGPIPELKGVAPEKLGTVADVFIGAAIQKELKAKDCEDLSQALSYFDPMPPENLIGFADFVVTKVEASDRKKRERDPNRAKKKSNFDFFCTAPGMSNTASK